MTAAAPHSILVVDDERSICALVQITLEREGHNVEVVVDGFTASRKLRGRNYDLLITDLLMPDRDGLELIREAKRYYPGMRILAMSGGGRVDREQYLKLAKGMGADAILTKPFLPRDLCSAVDNVLVPQS
jgi:DNA-binding response OmpR family regulator